jgi:hypothetical protein
MEVNQGAAIGGPFIFRENKFQQKPGNAVTETL